MACSRSWLARTSGYRQVTSHVHKHRTAHAKRGMNLLSACSHVRKLAVFEVGEQELKAQYLKKICRTATLWLILLLSVSPEFAVCG